MEEDDRPKKRLVHEIGQDLALLSVEELRERITLLRDEIADLRQRRRTSARPATPQTTSSRADQAHGCGAVRAGAFVQGIGKKSAFCGPC